MNRPSIPAQKVEERIVRLQAGQGSLGAELHLGPSDWRRVPRCVPQPWAEVRALPAGVDSVGAADLCSALLAEVEKHSLRELVVVALPTTNVVLDALQEHAPGASLEVSPSWPPMAPPPSAESPQVLHLYANGPDPRGEGAFRDSYEQALLATEADPTTAALFEQLKHEAEAIVREAASGEFEQAYGTTAVMVVGSSLRATYAALPADIDIIVLTRAAHDEFDLEHLRGVLRDIAGRIESSAAFLAYCQQARLGPGARAQRLDLSFLGLRGTGSLVARFDVHWGDTREERSLFLDISFGRIPRAIGYGLAMSRYLDGLPEPHRLRLQREIRLVRRLFKATGGLYDSPERGLRAHTIEQWLIQARGYRSSGIQTGTLDNLLRFIAEEGVTGPGALELMDFQEFKSRFPVWHPGVWETQVVPPGSPAVTLLDYLGDGDAVVAQEKWVRLMRLARAYVRFHAEDRAWSLHELAAAGRAGERGTA
jgi:predicted nucleotidyltransferase